MGRQTLLATAFASLLLLTALPPVASEAPPGGPPLRFGFAMGSVAELTAADVPLTYGSFWVGAWTAKSGWGYAASELDRARAANVTPVVNWWYWGDDISPSCVENGCWSSLHGVWKDKATWQRMSAELADVVATKMEGREAIVVLENEFNKNGIATHEPFDGYLAEQAAIFHARGIKTVVGFGFWGSDRWANFDRAVAASDYAGTMMLRSSLRHASSYDSSAQDLLVAAQKLQTTFGKRVLLYDFALSSYPEPDYALRQEAQLRALFGLMPDLRAANVEGVLFRHLYDNPNFDTRNYNGEAERWWGLKHADGSAKPAFDDAVAGIHEEAVHLRELGWTLPAGGAAETTLLAWKDAWYDVRIEATGAAPVTVSVDGVAVAAVAPGASLLLPLDAGRHTLRVSAAAATAVARLTWDDAPAPPDAPPLPGAREAEDFETKSTGGRYASPAASGGAGWNLWSNGHVEQRFRTDAAREVLVTVVAAGDLAGTEAPRMELTVNGMPAAAWSVPAADLRPYRARVLVPEGDVALRVAFVNDWYGGGKDRNLRVDAVRAEAAPLRVWTQEAEAFATKSTGGSYPDAAASGGAGWNLWSNGHVQTTFWTGLAGPQELRVVAKGDYAKGWPLMRVYVDGVKVGEWTVASSTYQTYAVSRDLAAGSHTLRVEFVNDYKAGSADRNLRVDAASVWVG